MKRPWVYYQRAGDVWAGFFTGFIAGGAVVVCIYEFGGLV